MQVTSNMPSYAPPARPAAAPSALMDLITKGDDATPQDKLDKAIQTAQNQVAYSLKPVFDAKKGMNFTAPENLKVGEKLLGLSESTQIQAANLHPLGSYENILTSWLGTTPTHQVKDNRNIMPLLPGLMFKAVNQVIADNYKVDQCVSTEGWQKEIVAPKTSQIQTDYNKTEQVISEGIWTLTDKDGNHLIAQLRKEYPWEPITLTVMANQDKPELVSNFYDQINDYTKNHNFYKNRVLEYVQTMSGEFMQFADGLKTKPTTWDDISLPQENLDLIKSNTVDFFKHIDIYKKNGKFANRNILLPGPPGTGKSMVNDILFTELKDQVTFIHVTSKSLGNANAVSGIFDAARSLQPCAVIFEDLDLVGSTTRNGNASKDVLNEFLNQLSGVYDNTGLVVLGSTNAANSFDPAMLRPLRFSTVVPMELPNVDLREKILHTITRNTQLAQDVDLHHLAEVTPDFSGAGLTELKELAIQNAIEKGSVNNDHKVTLREQDFDRGLEIVALKKEYLEKEQHNGEGGVPPAPPSQAHQEYLIAS